jgi:hypothetical protein
LRGGQAVSTPESRRLGLRERELFLSRLYHVREDRRGPGKGLAPVFSGYVQDKHAPARAFGRLGDKEPALSLPKGVSPYRVPLQGC